MLSAASYFLFYMMPLRLFKDVVVYAYISACK
jgi:hypothetical protein